MKHKILVRMRYSKYLLLFLTCIIVIASINAGLQYISIHKEIMQRQEQTGNMASEEAFLTDFYKPFLQTSRSQMLTLHRQGVPDENEIIITFPKPDTNLILQEDAIDVESHIVELGPEGSRQYLLNTTWNNFIRQR